MSATKLELVIPAKVITQTLDCDLERRHDLANTVNTLNNRGFAMLDGAQLVEIVRKCRKQSLVRWSLEDNHWNIERVSTARLQGYDHPVRQN